MNRQLGKRKKAIAMFVDLRAAFDTVDRGVLDKAIGEREIRKELVVKIEKARETRSRIRIEGQTKKSF